MAARGSVLLYNFQDKAKTEKVKLIFVLMGVRIKTVSKEEYLQPVGALAGALERNETVYEEEGFQDEMLVICHLTDAQMNQMLAYFRKEGIRIPLKAALTPTNQHWTSLELHEEIVREHEEVQKMMAEKKKAQEDGSGK